MKALWRIALAVAVLAVPALGQDSIAIPISTAIGDAVAPWDTNEQLNTYVVDLESITSSMGYSFGVAPLVKAGAYSGSYLNALMSAQGMSNTLLEDVSFPAALGNSYAWWDAPGYGVNDNPGLNTPPDTWIDTSAMFGHQFAVTFLDFGDSDVGENFESVMGAVVNYEPTNPNRLYVGRICAAVDGNGFLGTSNSGSFGMGAVDSHGNVHFRGDNFGAAGADPLDGENYFRVGMLDRNFSIFNHINLLGGTDAPATTELLLGSTVVHPTPSILPEQLAGRPVLLGQNWNHEYVYESTPGTVVGTTGHLATTPAVEDHRGCVGFSHALTSVENSVGTAGILAKISGSTIGLNLWDVDANGAVLNTYALQTPTSFDLGGGVIFGDVAFSHYFSQTRYSGGNAPIALGADLAGNGLAAGPVHQWESDFGYENPYNGIVVARFDPTNPADVEWTMPIYVVNTDILDKTAWDGAPIYGLAGEQIGKLCPLFLVTGADPTDPLETSAQGPSMSAPAIDALGNIYFVASCEFNGDPEPTHNNALVRAVYNKSDFSYKLEVVLRNRGIYHGQNSDTDYQISFMGIADSNSVASSTLWSGNLLQSASPLDRSTPGGVVLGVEVIYDSSGDGEFDPTPGIDEDYNVLMYVSPPACIRGDSNCDGAINAFDIDPFVIALADKDGWEAAYNCDYYCANDVNGDGAVNAFDIDPFVVVLASGG